MSDIDSADDDSKSNDDPNDLFKHTNSINPTILYLLCLPKVISSKCKIAERWNRHDDFPVLSSSLKIRIL
jgi:hypothetical protein